MLVRNRRDAIDPAEDRTVTVDDAGCHEVHGSGKKSPAATVLFVYVYPKLTIEKVLAKKMQLLPPKITAVLPKYHFLCY